MRTVRTPSGKPSSPTAKPTGYGSEKIKTPSTAMSVTKGKSRGGGAMTRGLSYTSC